MWLDLLALMLNLGFSSVPLPEKAGTVDIERLEPFQTGLMFHSFRFSDLKPKGSMIWFYWSIPFEYEKPPVTLRAQWFRGTKSISYSGRRPVLYAHHWSEVSGISSVIFC